MPISILISLCFIKIENLDISGNDFSGTIPSQWLATATNLKTLNLARNEKVIGKIPTFLGNNIHSIVELDLQKTGLTGTIPAELEQLKSMEKFFVHATALQGDMPDGVCSMSTSNGGQLRELTANCEAREGTAKVNCDCCTQCFW